MNTIGWQRSPRGGVKLPESESSTFIGNRVRRVGNQASSFIGNFAAILGIEAIQTDTNHEFAVDSPESDAESASRWSDTARERWLLLVEKRGPGAILQGLFPGPEIDDEAWMVAEHPVEADDSRAQVSNGRIE